MQHQKKDDFKEFLKLLIENKAEYLVVGGYAVAFHSRPRYTDDLDVWINKTPENLQKILKILKKFGFNDVVIDEREFMNETKVYRIGKPPVRIEILNKIDGVNFQDAAKHKATGVYEDIQNVSYISFEDLIKNKKASKRPKDKLDLDFLENYGKK
jgi:hypothetical protein